MAKISDTIDYEYNKLFGEDSEEQLKRTNNRKIQILCVGGFIIFLIVTATIFPLLFICYSTEETQKDEKETLISNAQGDENVGETTRNITQDNQRQVSKMKYIPHKTFIEESETEKTTQIRKSTPGQKRIRTSTPRFKDGKGSKNLDDLETSLSSLELSSIKGSGSKRTFFDSEESETTSSEDFDKQKRGKGIKRKYKDGQINSVRKRLNFTKTPPPNKQKLERERLEKERERLEKERVERLEREKLKNIRIENERLEKERLEKEAKNKVKRRQSTRITNRKNNTPATSVPPSIPE